jgi:CubicO group peptidase (beta-lactamase class C family)
MRIAPFLIAAFLLAQTTPLPDTPVGKMFGRWLESFNSGDRARIEAFMKVHEPKRLDSIDRVLDLREQTGGFALLAVTESNERSMKLRLREQSSGTVLLGEVAVSASDPPVIERFMFRPDPASAGPPPQRLDEKSAIEALDKHAQERAAADRFSGAILIAHDGKIVFEKAYGLADREQKTANTLDTKFRMGSMNKMFTSVAVLQLVAKGKISWDQPLAKYWPDYPNQELANKVKIRNLFSHTGGTGDIFGPEFDKHRLELKTLADYANLYGSRPLQFEPGSRWEYSNYGFLLLGLLVEKVAGHSYYDYVRENIFTPAGMTSTDSAPESETVARQSIGYMRQKGAWVPNTATLPWRGTSAGGGYTTVGDLFRFSQALLGGKLIPANLLEKATTSQSSIPDGPPGTGYGFGFGITKVGFGHSGGAPGMNGDLRIYPQSRRVVIVLANLDPPAAGEIAGFYENRMPAN